MRTDAPSLLPIFRSRTQAVVLAEVLLRPDEEFTLTDLAHRAGAALSTVHAEIERLVTSEVFSHRTVGRSRLVRANTANPAVKPLTELVAMTFGPLSAVRDAFEVVPGVYRVVLFGSWAARYLGEDGPPPNDVDVLVVGNVKRKDVYAAADAAEKRVRRPVNPVVVSMKHFEDRDSPLLRQIDAAPSLTVIGA